LPNDKTIGVYGEKDIHAAYAVTLLNQNHYEAYVLEDGIDAWIVVEGNTTWPCEPTG
jgi:rhodanese-related sulfurtransferase